MDTFYLKIVGFIFSYCKHKQQKICCLPEHAQSVVKDQFFNVYSLTLSTGLLLILFGYKTHTLISVTEAAVNK